MISLIHIQANGENLPGSNNQQQLGDEVFEYTEIYSLYQESYSSTSQTGSVSRTAGRVQHGPFTFVKAVDRISPLLTSALVENKVINANLRLYVPADAGQLIEYHRITLLQGRLTSLRVEMQDPTSPALERFTILADQVNSESTVGNTAYQYDLRVSA